MGLFTAPESGTQRERFRRVLLGPAAGLAAALAAGVPATARAQAAPVEALRVAGNIWRIDGAVDVIVAQTGSDGLLMVDTGYPFAEEGVRARLREIAGKEAPDLLLNTHWHHTFANHIYGAEAEIVAHEAVARRMDFANVMWGQVVPALPAAGRPDRTFTDSLTLTYNGERITLLHLPQAHTDGDAVVIFHEAGVVVTGDAVVPHMPWADIHAGGDMGAQIRGVEFLLERIPEDAIIVPGHDRTMSYQDLVGVRDFLVQAQDTVRVRMAAGMSLRRIQTLGLPGLAHWQGAGVPESLFIESLYRSLQEVRTLEGPTLRLDNGRWYDGDFRQRTAWVVDGVLTFRQPDSVDRVVDLQGGWVVPAFGEAHTHRLSNPARLTADAADFLSDGVFYAMVQDPSEPLAEEHRVLSGDPASVDVAYTQGVVAPSWSVIAQMYDMFARSGRYGDGVSVADLDGDVLFTLDTVEELEAAWPDLRSRNDDHIKVIVGFIDELEERRGDPERYGAEAPRYSAKPGVREDVLRALVQRAHDDGLRVSAHIETAADFRAAVDAGVDLIAHMPASWQVGEGTGYQADDRDPWLLTLDDARAARMAGVTVITTLSLPSPDDPRAPLFRQIHKENLTTLGSAGVKVAIGSDLFTGTSVDEALFLEGLGVFPDHVLLDLLAVGTPRAIFPHRKIGHLREGYEASFLVLGGDPTEDLSRIRDVRLRVKQGLILEE